MDTTPEFPSTAHQTQLQKRVLSAGSTPTSELPSDKIGYHSFSEPEKWEYHAYDYAWRRHFLNIDDQSSPIDRRGEWHNPRLIGRVMRMLYPLHRSRADPGISQKWRYRVAAAYRWRHDQGKIMPAGIPDRDARVVNLVNEYEAWLDAQCPAVPAEDAPKEVVDAWITDICARGRANMQAFVELTRQAGPHHRRSTVPSLAEQLGVRATERAQP